MTRIVEYDRRAFLDRAAEWDRLVMRSRTPSVFLHSAWLRACADTIFEGADVRAIVAVGPEGWLGAIAIALGPTGWTALGTGPSDYLDMPLDRALSDAARDAIAAELARAALASTGASVIALPSVPVESALIEHLDAAGAPFAVTRRTHAPSMQRHAFEGAVRKKSMKRHWNRLHRHGSVEVVLHRTADAVLPLLPAFFRQHQARWGSEGLPSQFDAPEERRLFERLAVELAAIGALRYTEVRLDGALAAAHFGTHFGGRYTWYKPTFAPELASLSPGEVLLRALVQQAIDEGADEFDFTVGDEAFKLRFATTVRDVVGLELHRHNRRAILRTAWFAARETLHQQAPGAVEWAKRWVGNA